MKVLEKEPLGIPLRRASRGKGLGGVSGFERQKTSLGGRGARQTLEEDRGANGDLPDPVG